MINLLFFYLRQFLIPFSVVIVAIVLQHLGLASLGPVAIGLVVVIMYKWNVTEKQDKTWRFFHALPITFAQKAVVKVFIPFTFVAVVWLLSENVPFTKSVLDGHLNSALLSAAALVLASLASVSIGSFILWFVGLWLSSLLFVDSGALTVLAAAVYLAMAIAKLSEARIPKNSALYRAAVAAIPLTLIAYYGKIPVMKWALKNGRADVKLLAADGLQKNGHETLAKDYVTSVLQTSTDLGEIREAVQLAERTDFVPPIVPELWIIHLTGDQELREDVLELMRSQPQSFGWVNIESIKEIEAVAVVNAQRCNRDCKDLGKYVGKMAAETQPGLREYIKSKLVSGQDAAIHYALIAVESDDPKAYREELVPLLNHSKPEVRRRVADLLNVATGKTVSFKNVEMFLDEIDGELTPKNKKELESLIEKYINPYLKFQVTVQ